MKARTVRAYHPNEWILAADTVVDLDGEVLGKPRSGAEAAMMLRQLRCKRHEVHTAVALVPPGSGEIITRCVTTQVWMRAYTDEEIEAYIATGDPMDKAGAYAIQHPGFQPVERLNRCYANVVGLPLCAVVHLLAENRCDLPVSVPELCVQQFTYQCPGPDHGRRIC